MSSSSQNSDFPSPLNVVRWFTRTTLSYVLVGLIGGALFFIGATVYQIGVAIHNRDSFPLSIRDTVVTAATLLYGIGAILLAFNGFRSNHDEIFRWRPHARSGGSDIHQKYRFLAAKDSADNGANMDQLKLHRQFEAQIEQLERIDVQVGVQIEQFEQNWRQLKQDALADAQIRYRLDQCARHFYVLAKLLEVVGTDPDHRNRF